LKLNQIQRICRPAVAAFCLILVVLPAFIQAVPLSAETTFTITAVACAGGTIFPPAQTTVNAGESITYTITPDPGKSIQEVRTDNITVDGAPSSYTFTDVQSDHRIAVSFQPYELKIAAGVNSITLGPSQLRSLPDYGATYADNETVWKGVPLYRVINQLYTGNSTSYSLDAVSSDTVNDITITNADYFFLEPETRDLFIVADQYLKDGVWIPVPPTSSGRGGWVWAPIRLIGNASGNGNSSAFKHFGAGLVELDLNNLAPWITTQPAGQTLTAGNNATFTASAIGAPTPTVQWQVSTDNGARWNDIAGATSTSLALTNVTTAQNGCRYQAIFTNTAGTTTTGAATLHVNAPSNGGAPPVFINPTVNATVNFFGRTAILAINSSGVIQQPFSIASEDGTLSLAMAAQTTTKDAARQPITNLEGKINANPPALPPGKVIIGTAFDLEPAGATFSPPLTLTYHYDLNKLPAGIAAADLAPAYFDKAAGKWVNLPATIDNVNQTLTISLSHFTTFAVSGTLPPAFVATVKNISPQEVEPGQQVTINGSVSNTGGKDGEYPAVLKINTVEAQRQTIKVNAGGNANFSFKVTENQPGDYVVEIGGNTGKFSVISPAAISVSDLVIQPAQVKPGETVTISAVVSNTGGREGSYAATLTINGIKQQTRDLMLAAGERKTVSFSVTEDSAGHFKASIDRLEGSFTVTAPVTSPAPATASASTTAATTATTVQPSATGPAPVSPAESGQTDNRTSWALITTLVGAAVLLSLGAFLGLKRRKHS
jgi:hypothetical protein